MTAQHVCRYYGGTHQPGTESNDHKKYTQRRLPYTDLVWPHNGMRNLPSLKCERKPNRSDRSKVFEPTLKKQRHEDAIEQEFASDSCAPLRC